MLKEGRKTTKVSCAECALATGRTTGNKITVVVTGPRLGAEQMEQEWCGVEELSGCEWTACAVPIATTSRTQSSDTSRTPMLRFAANPAMPSL